MQKNTVTRSQGQDDAAVNFRQPAADARIVGGPIPPEILNTVVSLGEGWGRKSHWWGAEDRPVSFWVERFSRFERGDKDGKAILQGRLRGNSRARGRTAESVSRLDVMMFDLDGGRLMINQVIEKLQARNLFAMVWTTHSHLKTVSHIPQKALAKWVAANPDIAGNDIGDHVRSYLIHVARYYPTLLFWYEYKGEAQSGKATVHVVEHMPVHKFRVLLVLERPFAFDPETHDQQRGEWKRRYMAVAQALGFDVDEACTDPSRLMYTPRIPVDAPIGPGQHEIALVNGGKLDLSKYELPPEGSPNATPPPRNDGAPPSIPADASYGERLLAEACHEVANAVHGTRNKTLNDVAYRVGRRAVGAGLDLGDVRARLEEAATEAGLPDEGDNADAVQKTIESGLQSGLKKPIEGPPDPAEEVKAFKPIEHPPGGPPQPAPPKPHTLKPHQRLQYLLDNYAYQAHGRDCVWPLRATVDTEPMTRGAFKVKFKALGSLPIGNKDDEIEITTAFFSSHERQDVEATAFRPDRPAPLFQEDGRQYLNTYKHEQHPDTGGTLQPWHDYLAHLIPDASERRLFETWLAHKWQHPEIPSFAVILVAHASYGTGRGRMREAIERLFGWRHVRSLTFPQLAGTTSQGQYTDWQVNSLLVTVDEAEDTATASPDWKQANHAYEMLKQRVDPGSRNVPVVRKGVANGNGRSFCSYLIATNHSDAVAIPENDRRFAVLSNGDPVTPQTVRAFSAWMDQPGNIGALAAHLAAMDLAGFDPYEAPPMTLAKQEMVELARTSLDRDVDAAVEALPGKVFTVDQVMRRMPFNGMGASEAARREIARRGHRIGDRDGSLQRVRRADGTRVTTYARSSKSAAYFRGLGANVVRDECLKNGDP